MAKDIRLKPSSTLFVLRIFGEATETEQVRTLPAGDRADKFSLDVWRIVAKTDEFIMIQHRTAMGTGHTCLLIPHSIILP